MTLIAGIILAICVISLDIIFISLGLKNIDPLQDPKFILKIALPAMVLEIAFIIWVSFNLPTGVLLAILILSASGMILKGFKVEGYKFYLYVLIPFSEIIIISVSMGKYLINT